MSTPENTLSYTPKAKVDEIRRENYDTQVDAYTFAAKDEYLAKHVPQFLGVADVASVHDKTGKDVSNEYLLSCCYAVQRIEGKDEKLNPLADDTPAHVKGFVDRCWAVGIKYTKDASVFNGNDPDRSRHRFRNPRD